MEIKDLTPAQCVLLTVHLASESNINALHSFTPTRLDALDPELVLRILLTYLPEALDPREYSNYVEEVASRLYLNIDRKDAEVNTAPVKDLSAERAEKRVKKLHLLPIQPPNYPPHAPDELLTRFLCHRAYRIDTETGLLDLVPPLIEPFLGRNDYIRTWYISVVLPLWRLEAEYYPKDESLAMPLAKFEDLDGAEGVRLLLQKAAMPQADKSSEPPAELSRDIKGLLGPYMYGDTHRKRRKLEHVPEPGSRGETADTQSVALSIRKISLSGAHEEDQTNHDWEHLFRWLAHHSINNFEAVSSALDEWDGPSDVDLGGFDHAGIRYLDEEVVRKLELQYAQVAFASCYAAQANTEGTVKAAHGVLARLAELLDFIPPPDLASSVASLPQIERHATKLEESQTVKDLLPEALLLPEHPLTTPRLETYMLLQMMVYSAYQFAGLGYPLSLINVAKLHFYAGSEEQTEVLKKILHQLSTGNARKDETRWTSDRAKLLWLFNWGIEIDPEHPEEGAGVLGRIRKDEFEKEMLKAFVETSCYHLATEVYIHSPSPHPLSHCQVEGIVIGKVMEAYDGASNGNKTRGGVKKVNDIISAFRSSFPGSAQFQQTIALVAATHALSFYSLTLHHGVPFKPVNIRVSQDPIALISKVLEQNPRSYTKLDDLIDIARNLVSAGLHDEDAIAHNQAGVLDTEALASIGKEAERRVTFMAIEAALREHDFETAYSYIVNRLTPEDADIDGPKMADDQQRPNKPKDDISWRAAFLAGRYRPSTSSPPTLRRLEQRTELLSLALLLAPTSALTEILAAWRRCEEEMTALQLSQQQAEDDFDDRADKRLSGGTSSLPGNFTVTGEQPELVLNQRRREMGRMGSSNRGQGETPLSMFDLTRNAAKVFSKNAFPLRESARNSTEIERPMSMHESTGSLGSGLEDGQQRVRRRDMVANAVSGGLASGIGWVLGAQPTGQQQQQPER